MVLWSIGGGLVRCWLYGLCSRLFRLYISLLSLCDSGCVIEEEPHTYTSYNKWSEEPCSLRKVMDQMAYRNEAEAGGCCDGGRGGGGVFVEAVFWGHLFLSLLGGICERGCGKEYMVTLGLLYLWYVRGCFVVAYLGCSSCGWILMVFLFVGGVRIRIRCRFGGCLCITCARYIAYHWLDTVGICS